MKKILVVFLVFIVTIIKLQAEVLSLENKVSATTSGSVVAVVNGKVIKINNIKDSQYELSVESADSAIKFDNNISNYLELLDINKNKMLLRDSIKANTTYFLLNLNENKLQELTDIHNAFEKKFTDEVNKNKERLYKINYYEHYFDDSGVIWFRYSVTLVGKDVFYVANGIANSSGKYYQTGANGTIVNFTKSNNNTFYALNVDETPVGNTIKSTASLLKISQDFSVKPFNIQYDKSLKDSRIEVTNDDLIYLFTATNKSNVKLYSMNSYKLSNTLLAINNFPSLKEKIIDVSKDSNGILYVLLQGRIDKIDKGNLSVFANVDDSRNSIQVYDEKNYIVSNIYEDKSIDRNIFSYAYESNYDMSKEISNIEEDTKKVLSYNKSTIKKDSENTINIKNLGNNVELKFDPSSINGGKGSIKIIGSNLSLNIPLSAIIINKYNVGDYISVEISISNLPVDFKNKYEISDKLYKFRILLNNSKNEIVRDYSNSFSNKNVTIDISSDFINNEKKIGLFSINSIEENNCKMTVKSLLNDNTAEFSVDNLGKYIIGEIDNKNSLVNKVKVDNESNQKVLNNVIEQGESKNQIYYLYFLLMVLGGIITVLVIIWTIRRNTV